MSLKGILNSPFEVLIKMKDPIQDTHTLRLKTLVEGPLQFVTDHLTFTPDNYDDTQPFTVIGKILGTHKVLGVTTTPYYENKAHKLRETTTEFEVEIVSWIGWTLYQIYYAGAANVMGCATLTIGGTAETGLGGTFSVGAASGGNTTNGLTFYLVKPDTTLIACDTDISGPKFFVADQPGVYYLYFSGRTGAGAYGAAHTQNIKLGNGVDNGLNVFFAAEALYFIDAGTQSVLAHSGGDTTGTMTLWSSWHPAVFAEVFPCSISCWYTPSGFSGSLADWLYTAVSNAEIAWKLVGASSLSSGTLARNYGYYFNDNSTLPPYDGINDEWHYGVGRVTSITTF